MIKVGIIGCDNPRAAELVRVLINHPDVELMWVASNVSVGARLEHVVPGIVGECDLTVTGEVALDNVNLVYLCESRDKVSARLAKLAIPAGLKLIDMSGCHNLDHGEGKPWKYGLSEMQRRQLVHDTDMITVPGPAAVVSLLALMPLVRNQLLNSPVSLRVAMGNMAFADKEGLRDGMSADIWARREVEFALCHCQSGYSQPIDLSLSPIDERRTLAVAACFKCNLDGDKIRELYEQYYDDHRFVFIVDRPIVAADVENTNKCLIRLDKDEQNGELTVHAEMDLLLKGSAGTAVHAMNLLFGLHELAGLALKGTGC